MGNSTEATSVQLSLRGTAIQLRLYVSSRVGNSLLQFESTHFAFIKAMSITQHIFANKYGEELWSLRSMYVSFNREIWRFGEFYQRSPN